MKKLIVFFTVAFCGLSINAQNSKETPGPEDAFQIVDNYGNKYKLSDLRVNPGNRNVAREGNSVLTATLLCQTSLFNVYFENGSGMEGTSQIEIDRRGVVCRVLEDLSAFIKSPLQDSGNTARVNIWVRNIANISNVPSSVIGLVTPLYVHALNAGGIGDNEVWKTIHNGRDSYTNITSPLLWTPGGVNQDSGIFFHAIMAFNFSASWNTSLSALADSNHHDLYTVILHEMIHTLGFASQIGVDGNAFQGMAFNYYSRYDRFLRINNNALISSANANLPMYNQVFNPAPSVLYPGCTIPSHTNTTGIPADETSCATAIHYVSSIDIPVYTPICFEGGSSLSHFEDECIGPPNANQTNSYYTMTNSNGQGFNKRFLRIEERQVLMDLGYTVRSCYGNNTNVLNSFINYNGSGSCDVFSGGIDIGGINDGFQNGSYAYFATAGQPYTIPLTGANGILTNDRMATAFEGLQDLTDSAALIPVASGTNSATVTINSNKGGLHLLRYVPINATGQRGNITYVFLYVFVNATTFTNCNMVGNSDFETSSGPITTPGAISLATGWNNANIQTPDYLRADAVNVNVSVPCSAYGYENDFVSGNTAYAAVVWSGNVGEAVITRLASQLVQDVPYRLTFDISRGESYGSGVGKMQAYFTTQPVIATGSTTTIANPAMFFESPTFSTVKNGWDHMTINIPGTSNSGEQYLSLGYLNNPNIMASTSGPANVGGCNYTTSVIPTYVVTFFDNVVLTPVAGTLNLPQHICNNASISNLSSLLESAPGGGVFSGAGVTQSGGVYSFNGASAGIGTKTVTYTYTVNGCGLVINTQIIVDECVPQNGCDGTDLTYDTLQPVTTAEYHASNTILLSTNYVVASGSDILLTAGNSITFTPLSDIQYGSTLVAKIEPCPQNKPGNDVAETPLFNEASGLTIYPNPSKGTVNLTFPDSEKSTILLMSIDGKMVYSNTQGKGNSCQIDMANYQNGIYIVTLETSDGKVFRDKIIKN